MGDFVGKEEVDRIRAHYRAYMADGALEKGDNRATPVSGAFDASTFREVSSWYVNRLLRYIKTQEMIDELLKEGRAAILRECLMSSRRTSARTTVARTTQTTGSAGAVQNPGATTRCGRSSSA